MCGEIVNDGQGSLLLTVRRVIQLIIGVRDVVLRVVVPQH